MLGDLSTCHHGYLLKIISPFFKNLIIFFMTIQVEQTGDRLAASAIQQTSALEAPILKQSLVPIHVPEAIALRIKSRLIQTEFTTVDEYASAVLDSVLAELEKDSASIPTYEDKGSQWSNESEKANVFSKQDQEDIEERLRGLGYM
jgi:hypothetical protein